MGDQVLVQDQSGKTPRQWSLTGVVIKVGPYDSYLVSLLGSRKVTRRNRQFLRKISPKKQSNADSNTSPNRTPSMLPLTSFQSTMPSGTRTLVHTDKSPSASLPAPPVLPLDAPSLDQSVPLVAPEDRPCEPSDLPHVPDGGQHIPPIKLRRSGPPDHWVVAGQQSYPSPYLVPGSSYPYPCSGAVSHGPYHTPGPFPPYNVGRLGLGQMLPPEVYAPPYSCSSCLPRFGY